MEQTVIGSFGFLKLLVLQWNSHPSFLIYVRSKLKLIQNISHLREWQQNTENGKSLFTRRFHSWLKKKARLKWPHLPSGRFMKVFYETTTSPRRPLLRELKGGFFIQVWLYSQQICQHGNISWRTPTHKVTWFFDHVVLWSHVTY